MENNVTYFERRASQEQAAALCATHPRARQAHLDMAQQYGHLSRRVEMDERRFPTYPPSQDFAELEAADPEIGTARFAI